MGAMQKSVAKRPLTFPVKQRKSVPYEFVLDAISPLPIETRPMFGCLAVYVGDKIVLMLREKPKQTEDNGVWLATTEEHHESLRREFPHMRSIQLFGKEDYRLAGSSRRCAGFRVKHALRACELIVARDPRIGKVPESRADKESKTEVGPSKAQGTSNKSPHASGRVPRSTAVRKTKSAGFLHKLAAVPARTDAR